MMEPDASGSLPLQASLSRRSFVQMAAAAAAAGLGPAKARAQAGPAVVYWISDSTQPGDLVMAIGGGLGSVRAVRAWRLEDGDIQLPGDAKPATPAAAESIHVVQSSDDAIQFQLPAGWQPGLFGVDAGATARACINRPLVWFIQPVHLLPGLADNETAAGVPFQIVGKDFLLPGDLGKPAIAYRAAGGSWRTLMPDASERFSLTARMPLEAPPGEYEIAVHHGFGGAFGWSQPVRFRIKQPEVWPQAIYDVRTCGALGDDVTDDTEAIRKALKMAGKNGGGIVYFPFGTYRLSGPIMVPARTVLRGAMRDISILKWPEDEPMTLADFTPAAVYTASQFGLEDLTLIARKVDNIVLDLSFENTHRNTVPREFGPYMRPWSQYRDIFIRRVQFQHWLSAGHPDRNTDPKMVKKYWSGDGPFNLKTGGCVNFEVSDCIFQGGNNGINGPQNGRVTNNSFSNEMNYSWTVLGGGARRLVVTCNEIRASSSFGFGSLGLQYVYSAHNTSYNFVRGEREAMTLDVSSMPTKRAVAEYWGAPIEVHNEAGSVMLRFPPASAPANSDGFRTGFLPGTFRGGQAVLHAYDGGAGAGQTRTILDNTADSVTLDRPWDTPPETAPRRLYLELSPRKNESAGVTAAWVGLIDKAAPGTLTGRGAQWVPGEFIDQAVLVLDGPGAGQYRVITANTATEVTLDRPWDVMPAAGAAIGIWEIVRHMIVYKSSGFDTSAFAQLYGSGYDYTVDSCTVERNQGIWGQMGWFVQLRYNKVDVGYSYHKGIGPPGPTPEHNSPFGIVGLDGGQLRLTKFSQVQYPEIPAGTAVFVDKLVGRPVPIGLATVIRRNHLRWNERIVLGSSTQPSPPVRFRHATIDGNVIEHGQVGVQIGSDVQGVAAAGNRFVDVKTPYLAANKASIALV